MGSLSDRLRASAYRSRLVSHRLFREAGNGAPLPRDAVATILGQWWHPLHYFPTFLASTVSQLDGLSQKSYVADILNEELGEGDPDQAHERIFVETMRPLGFSTAELCEAAPLEATRVLLAGYRAGAGNKLQALGCLFATEVADLAMVGSIGKIVRKYSGAAQLPWVDIHVSQEPNHVEKATRSLSEGIQADQVGAILDAADQHWADWCSFFDSVHSKCLGAAAS